MKAVDAIFFDVDGTLVDASKDIIAGVNFTLGKLGCGRRPGGEIMSYVGTGVKYLIEKSLGNENVKFADEGVRIFSGYYTRHAADNARLYPHAREVLEYFRGKKKFILTNRYEKFADATLKGLEIRKCFKAIIAGDDENCLKPDVCVLSEVLKTFSIDKARSIIVGDMAIDVMTGKNSGIKTCWVTYGLGKRKDVEPLKPDYIVKDLIELKDIIE